MSEIIKISSEVIGTEKTNSVNARELHQVLDIKKQFANWIDIQINSLGLEKNVDYIVYEVKGNGRPQKEYIITTDTAKHISMASRTAKGKEVRNYFIQIEKEYKTLIENPNIHELSGRVGGLTRSNNDLRRELDKWKKKSKRRFENLEDDVEVLKKRPIMITHKGLDEKLEILFRKSDILANEKTECFWQEALQNHLRFYKEYVEILKSDGNIPQQWAINQVEKEKNKRTEIEKELSHLKWRFEIMLEKIEKAQQITKNILSINLQEERNLISIT